MRNLPNPNQYSRYSVYSGRNYVGNITLGQGGVYTFFLHGNQDLGYEQTLSRFMLTHENSVHMLWQVRFKIEAIMLTTIYSTHQCNVIILLQVPGYIIMTTGEIMLSITGLEFSYSQVCRYLSHPDTRGYWKCNFSYNVSVPGVHEICASSCMVADSGIR